MTLRQLSVANAVMNVVNKHFSVGLHITFARPILYEVELRDDKLMYMKLYKIIFWHEE